ncbi:2-ketogluconate utilization repressor PtxS [Klebsiella variicola]|uniref:2-ketogluconate utilization repressor PtxS n=1 Tax=Klebsiella variicola TaxID=244366 RepID=A0A7H4M9I0_KLEVA|nr:2-ketogluconate utilization repressor PtxS [Klebsiella variicola]
MVLIDRKIPDFACDVVGLDNAQAATTATEHLVEKGFGGHPVSQRTAGLGEYPPRASERFSRYPSLVTTAWWLKTPKCSSTTAR